MLRINLFLLGCILGLLAGICSILLSRLFDFVGFLTSRKEEIFAFWAFVVLGVIMGAINALTIKLPPASKKTFDDGSSIEWVDRETVKYINGHFAVNIWVDFEDGFFSTGRVIKPSLITKWDTVPTGHPILINDDAKKGIVNKLIEYYRSNNRKCRLEEI